MATRPKRSSPPLEYWRGVGPRGEQTRVRSKTRADVANRRDDRRSRDRPDAGDRHQRLRLLVGLRRRLEFLVDGAKRRVERLDLIARRLKRRAHAFGNDDRAEGRDAIAQRFGNRPGWRAKAGPTTDQDTIFSPKVSSDSFDIKGLSANQTEKVTPKPG